MAVFESKVKWTRLALAGALLAAPVVLAQAEYRAEVEQGGVARWGGDDIVACGMDGRTFEPVDGVCFYPIDFERSPNSVEVARHLHGGGRDIGWLTIVVRDFPTQEIEFPDERFVHLSDEDLLRHYSEQARLKPLLNRGWSAEPRFSIPLASPVDPLPTGSGFGAPRLFNGEPKNAHTGVDYAIAAGTPVSSIADGEVIMAEEHFFAGLGVYMDHGNGLFSMVFHLQKATVSEGDMVSQGDQLGEIGSTGRSTGPHLHLGMRWRGARIDPEWLISRSDAIPDID